jgi:hypothetical protein
LSCAPGKIFDAAAARNGWLNFSAAWPRQPHVSKDFRARPSRNRIADCARGLPFGPVSRPCCASGILSSIEVELVAKSLALPAGTRFVPMPSRRRRSPRRRSSRIPPAASSARGSSPCRRDRTRRRSIARTRWPRTGYVLLRRWACPSAPANRYRACHGRKYSRLYSLYPGADCTRPALAMCIVRCPGW